MQDDYHRSQTGSRVNTRTSIRIGLLKNRFCAKCGAGASGSESYCRRCGEWLLNRGDSLRPALLRQWKHDAIKKIRVLEVLSTVLSLMGAAGITIVLITGLDTPVLILAMLCCVTVAIYQLVNICLGHELEQGIERSRSGAEVGRRP